MFRYIVRRLLQMVLTFFGSTFLLFALVFANQTDPIQALVGERPITASQRLALTQRYHLDEGFFGQYWYYIKGLLTGDLGMSLTGRKISQMMADAWPVTLRLAVIAIVMAAVFSITAGVYSAIKRGGIFDNSSLLLTLILLAMPIVVIAPLFQLVFAMQLHWFTATATRDATFTQLLLPAIVLACIVVAPEMRVTRTSVVENLRADYVRTARAKGLTRMRVIWVHVLRNSLIPVITLIGVDLGTLMAGAIVTEHVFNIPGVGFNLARAIRTEDGPLVVGFVSILVILFLFINLLVDLLYAALDPRIRYE
ncbi:peptide ABC transporter [Actinoplanes sp. SE50]|uniref:ABC transporter permease n=1 Tax=unclassified Actinoplanes TaxID=2626549 RepID=UPI00023EBCB1|nr:MULTISPECIES: ABC transporter permease [unclassified Actinoplanes]AEV81780.1 Glutathione transport system permease protein gsiC [Actinoplanes sp. SE50/110]ATO80181.1 peptide ABC transporter [Actinoplanes sp. SE50]SLL97585.1 ABC-type peptide/nickel transporter, permease component [Actinoplanes sp. SE50/110]